MSLLFRGVRRFAGLRYRCPAFLVVEHKQVGHRFLSSGPVSAALQWKAHNEQGVKFLSDGQYVEAEMVLRQGLDALEQIPASDPNFVSQPKFKSTTMANLGSVYRRLGKPHEAVTALKAAYEGLIAGNTNEMGQEQASVDRAAVGRVLIELAHSYEELNQTQEALWAYEESRDMFEAKSAPHTQCLISIAGLLEKIAAERIQAEAKEEEGFPEEIRSGPSGRAMAMARAASDSYEDAVYATLQATGNSVIYGEVCWSAATWHRSVGDTRADSTYQKAIEAFVESKDLRFMEVVDELASVLDPSVAEAFTTPYAHHYNVLLAKQRGETLPEEYYAPQEGETMPDFPDMSNMSERERLKAMLQSMGPDVYSTGNK